MDSTVEDHHGHRSPVRAVKDAFWNQITRLYDRHYGTVTGAPEPELYPRVHYVMGEAGYPNYGDELIAREWVKYLAMIDPDTPVVFDCLCAGPAAAVLYECHPRISVVDTTAQLGLIAHDMLLREMNEQRSDDEPRASDEDLTAAQVAERITAALDAEGEAARYAAGLRIITRHSRDVHVIGGGYLNSMWEGNLARLIVPQWAQAHGIPAIVSGVGLEPLASKDYDFCANVARTITAFSCRDQPSRTDIDPDGQYTTLAADDCFVNGLEGVYVPQDQWANLPDIMTCSQTDLVADKRVLLDAMMRILEAWHVPQGTAIGVVECIPYDSMDMLACLREHGYEPRLFPLQDLLEQGFPARPGQTWLSTRYHLHLLASAMGCKGTFIVVKPDYYGTKHEAVLRMGSRWTSYALDSVTIPQPGLGFADPNMRFTYRDRIRNQAAAIYQ